MMLVHIYDARVPRETNLLLSVLNRAADWLAYWSHGLRALLLAAHESDSSQ
jgi:hypothetical protein